MRLLPGNIVGIEVHEFQQICVSDQYIYRSLNWNREGKIKSWAHTKLEDRIYIHLDSLPVKVQKDFEAFVFKGIEPVQYILCNLYEEQAAAAPDFSDFSGISLRNEEAQIYAKSAAYFWVWVNRKALNIKQNGFDRDTLLKTLRTLKSLKNLRLPTDLKHVTAKEKLWKECEAAGENPAKVLIHGGLSNKRASKINELSHAIIEELASKHYALGFAAILRRYNKIASEKGLKSIKSPKTISKYAPAPDITPMRTGIAEFDKYFNPIITRDRPDVANRLWVGDGWTVELYYQKQVETPKGGLVTKHWNRKTVYMVIDAFNDYIVGYHISDSETVEATKKAWKNAAVSSGALPDYIKTDNWAWKELTPFYEAITGIAEKYVPSEIGNARDKVIEPFFNQFNTQCLQGRFPNWAGKGIKAKTGVNSDYLDKIRHQFPDEAGVIEQIETAIIAWNNSCRKGVEISRCQEWEQARRAGERKLSDINRLQLFGVEHPRKEGVTYTNKGINITIDGVKMRYQEWENVDMQSNIGKQYNVLFDPDNTSVILLYSDSRRETYLLQEDIPVPMVPGDFKEGQRELLNKKLNYQKEAKKRPVKRAEKRAELIGKAGMGELLEDYAYSEAVAKVQPIEKGRQKEQLNASEAALKVRKRDETYTPYKRGEIGGVLD